MSDIDPETGFEYGVAQRPGAPFPEATNIPSTHTTLDEPKGIPSGFDDDVVPKTKDASLDEPGDHDTPFDEQPKVIPEEQKVISDDKPKTEDAKVEEKPKRGRAAKQEPAKEVPADSDASKEEA